MNTTDYLNLKEKVIEAGYAEEIAWAENITPCSSPTIFWMEYSWVVINSGMKNQVAKIIWTKIQDSLKSRTNLNPGWAHAVFKHQGKCDAIEAVWYNQNKIMIEYLKTADKLSFLESLPWIGKITKYHLAKNLGFDCCKPDRHLIRIAKQYNMTPEELCRKLSLETGDKIALVDTVIWRAANLGMI